MTQAKIRFVRDTPYSDRIRAYRLHMDGQSVGRLKNGDMLEIPVSAGRRCVVARIDWCRSRPLEVDVAEGQTVTIEVTNTFSAILALWAITFGMFRYLTLRVIR